MIADDFCPLVYFAQRLQEVVPILGRTMRNDDHRLMSLPLVYYEDPLPNGFDADTKTISPEAL